MNNYSQYYGSPPMQANQPLYQPPLMPAHPPGLESYPIVEPQRILPPSPVSPVSFPNQVLPVNQYPMNQNPMMNQYGTTNYQPTLLPNNVNMGYRVSTPTLSPQHNVNNAFVNPNQVSGIPSTPNYQVSQPDPSTHFAMQHSPIPFQQTPASGVYPTGTHYGVDNQAVPNQLNYNRNMQNPLDISAIPNTQQCDNSISKQTPYLMSTPQQVPSTQPSHSGDAKPAQVGETVEPELPKKTEPTQNTGHQTSPYLVGHYKCSDLPNLFTGPFRYSTSQTQRKPFTMRGDNSRATSKPSPNLADAKTCPTLSKQGKRWELRGGKYYGCFTSRTNGLQDICTKAKCKICPNDIKKK